MLAAGPALAGAFGLFGIGAVAAVAPGGGIDLAGLALVITAISGFIATLGGLVIALRKRPVDPMQAALAQAFLEQAARLKQEQEGDG